MPPVTVATQSLMAPPGQWVSLLSITSMNASDFSNGTRYLGTEGVFSTQPSGATPFDVRAYSRVLVLIKMGALTGGSTPAIEWDFYHLAYPETSTNATHGFGNASIPAAGGAITATFGQGQPSGTGNGTYFTSNSLLMSFSTLFPFMRLGTFISSAPTGLTAPNYLYVYGITNR